ncbi:McrC family protein [Mycolicibacter kumamotonensis]|uniref:Restriction endonuclease n=1 Tax=Mycolicibacter kumamotonensis TaxID=354243 RepID=A0A1B8SGM0_9MYCO|nr:hypothetical protein [Mycolicibacter kumamotonensis]OBY31836.1 hypothetical protein ACT18_10000 [Mycolicibacter kumamotonensis]
MVETIELAEYETRFARAQPTTDDARLADRLSAHGDASARLDVRWLANNRVEIRASSWVGVVRFSGFEVRIVPKLAGGALRVLQMIEYTNGVRLLTHLPREQQLPANGNDLFELIVMALIHATRSLIRDGLIRDYRPMDDTLTVMRGRLRVRDQFLRRYGSFHRLECQFDEYDGNIPENQLLAAALTASATCVRNDRLRTDARILAGQLADICEPPTRDPEWYFQRIHYGRRNKPYQPAHDLARLVLNGLALSDLTIPSSQRVTAFLLNMNTLFERFVTRLVNDSLNDSPLRAAVQSGFRSVIIDDTTGNAYSAIRPDLVVVDTQTGDRAPVDIKYKLYDTKKLDTADIYQLFTYAYALGGGEYARRAGLIYASTTSTTGPALRIMPAAGVTDARIYGVGIDIPRILEALGTLDPQPVYAEVRSIVQQLTGLACNLPAPAGVANVSH